MMHLRFGRNDITNLNLDLAILIDTWEGGHTWRVTILDYNVQNIWNTISSISMTPNSRANWNQNGKDVESTKDNFTRKSCGNTINYPLP
jgi:hypothetical protein